MLWFKVWLIASIISALILVAAAWFSVADDPDDDVWEDL